MIKMTRRMVFSAAHSNRVPAGPTAADGPRTDAGALGDPTGHTYTLDVSVRGPIDPKTGIVVNIKEIDRIVKQYAVGPLDGSYINRKIPAFHNRPVTLETLVGFIGTEIVGHLPESARLAAIRIESTPLDVAEWRSEEELKMTLPGLTQVTRVYEFSASHRLHSIHLSDEQNVELFGKCNYANGHGHNYVLEVTVAGPIDDHTGRIIDVAALDAVVHREVVDRYDHRHLNLDIPEFRDLIPSSEVVTKVIWDRLQDHIPAPARLISVLLRETPRNFFEYRGEDTEVR